MFDLDSSKLTLAGFCRREDEPCIDSAVKELEDLWKIAEKFDELLQGGYLLTNPTNLCIECEADLTDERGHYEDCKTGKAVHALRRLMYSENASD